MSDYVNGTYRIVYVKWNDEYLPIGCLSSSDFNEDVEMLGTTTQDNNGWKTSVPTKQKYSFSVSGLIINTNFNKGDFTKVSYDRLRVLKRGRTLIDWKIEDIDAVFSETGSGYITSLSDTANIDEYISFNASINGYLKPVINE